MRFQTLCRRPLVVICGLMIAGGADGEEAYPASVARVDIESSKDGERQPALFYAPEGSDKVPLLVALHTWSSDWKNTYNVPLAKGCIARGWAFLHPNFRGSNNTPQGGGSDLAVADVIDAVAWAVKRGNIDPDRVYLAGASGGGHMALQMAGRAPQLWAGVSSWVPIADCAAWHAECVAARRKYAADLEKCCGGKPGDGVAVDAEYKRRSPLTSLSAAQAIPVSINAGIRDGHQGSVPISHTLKAFNVLADPKARISAAEIEHFTKTATVPESLVRSLEPVPSFGKKPPLWRRDSRQVSVTIFDGGHEMVPEAIFEFLSTKRRAAQKSVPD